jgi:YHS domain-containing protein
VKQATELEESSMATAIDPVCGMEVDPATAAGSSEYQGETYYFCSVGCKRQFDKAPEQYTDSEESQESPQ